MASDATHTTSARHVMWVARLVVLVAFLDLFMQFPTVSPFAEGLGASAAFAGIIVGAYSFTNMFGNLGAGFVIDRFGRRVPVLIGLGITSIAVATYAMAQSPDQLLISRALHGLAAAMLAPGAFAIVGDSTRSGSRAHSMGLTGATIAIAALVGPPIAGILKDSVGAESVFLLASGSLAVTYVVFWAATRNLQEGKPVDTVVSQDRSILTINPMLGAYATALAFTIGLGALVAYMPIMLEAQGVSSARVGSTFGIFAIIALIAMGSPISRLSDRKGRLGPLMGGLALIAVSLAVVGLLADYTGVALGMATFGLGYGLVFPTTAAIVSESSGADRRGLAFGVFYAVYSLGVVIGSVGSGVIAETLQDPIGLPFLISVGAVVVLGIFAWFWIRNS